MEQIMERATHKLGDYVMYRNNGICEIVDISSQRMGGANAEYYILQSVYNANTKIFVPVASPLVSEMRHILSVGEIHAIIDASEESGNEWVDDSKLRASKFEQIMADGDRAQILWLVKVLSMHKVDVEGQKRKFYASDLKILTLAEKIITEEFAFALGISKDEVIPYIVRRIESTTADAKKIG